MLAGNSPLFPIKTAGTIYRSIAHRPPSIQQNDSRQHIHRYDTGSEAHCRLHLPGGGSGGSRPAHPARRSRSTARIQVAGPGSSVDTWRRHLVETLPGKHIRRSLTLDWAPVSLPRLLVVLRGLHGPGHRLPGDRSRSVSSQSACDWISRGVGLDCGLGRAGPVVLPWSIPIRCLEVRPGERPASRTGVSHRLCR